MQGPLVRLRSDGAALGPQPVTPARIDVIRAISALWLSMIDWASALT